MAIESRVPSSGARSRGTRATEEGTASSIYGAIVGGAVLVTSPAQSPLDRTVSVLVTLVVYWSAERYSRLMAARAHEGHRPSWAHVRVYLTTGWEIVTVSFIPLAVLLVLSLVGVDVKVATLAALGCTTALLFVTGWEIGRHGRLSPMARTVSACVAALFGAVLITLEALLH